MSEHGTSDSDTGYEYNEGFNQLHSMVRISGERSSAWKDIEAPMSAHRRSPIPDFQVYTMSALYGAGESNTCGETGAG